MQIINMCFVAGWTVYCGLLRDVTWHMLVNCIFWELQLSWAHGRQLVIACSFVVLIYWFSRKYTSICNKRWFSLIKTLCYENTKKYAEIMLTWSVSSTPLCLSVDRLPMRNVASQYKLELFEMNKYFHVKTSCIANLEGYRASWISATTLPNCRMLGELGKGCDGQCCCKAFLGVKW